MTFTEIEIETALSWHRRTNDNYVSSRDILSDAASRTSFEGNYDEICEHILRTTINER